MPHRAGAGRPAPRALQADLVDAEEVEPDARPQDMELVVASSQRSCLERFTSQGLLVKETKIGACIMADVLRIFHRLVGLCWSAKCMYRIAYVVR